MNKIQQKAFPHESDQERNDRAGMTIRDYFAAKVLQSAIENAAAGTGFGLNYTENNMNYAKAAYSVADAMMEARKE